MTPPYCVRQVARRCEKGHGKRSLVGHVVPLICCKYVYSVAPQKYIGGGHGPSQCLCCAYVHMYIYLTCALSTYVQNVHSYLNLACIYVYKYFNATATWIGDWRHNGPLLWNPVRFFILWLANFKFQEQDRVLIPLGPMVPCTLCKYLPMTSLSFILVILKPQSRHLLSCFLGALAQAFFCRQPTQGSYWCLNIHLVSCILYSTVQWPCSLQHCLRECKVLLSWEMPWTTCFVQKYNFLCILFLNFA